VHIAEPLFEAHHGLAVRGEAEMARLDDAGMHRTHRDLVQSLPAHRQEGVVGRIAQRRVLRSAERRGYAPGAVVEPRALVGTAFRIDAVEIADGPLQPQRWRMRLPDRGKGAARQYERHHNGRAAFALAQREMHRFRIAPERE
jgi:hypothetical protein